ncbi:MAG: DoxX family protein [Planctomycetaceae bacterium]
MRTTGLNLGLLVLRLGLAAMMFPHGWMKWEGREAMAANFPDPFNVGPQNSLYLAIFAEVACSGLLAIGFLTRLACIPLIVTMCVAIFIAHGADPWAKKELAAMYLTGYATLFLTGPGAISLDWLLWGRGGGDDE